MAGENTLNGADYLVEIDIQTPITAEKGSAYNTVLCEVSSNFNISTEELAVSGGCSGDWKSSIPGRRGFGFSGEWQAIDPRTGDPSAISMNTIVELAATGAVFWIRRKLRDGNTGMEVYREGRVWINQYEDVATAEDPFTFTASFVGIGEPNISGGYEYIGVLHDSEGNIITKGENLIIVKA